MKHIKHLFFICAMMSALVLSSCSKAAQAKLESLVEKEAKNCPIYIDDGLLGTHIFIEGNNVVCVLEVDETQTELTVGDLDDPSLRREIKEELIEDLRHSSDPDDKEMRQLLKDAEYNLIYRFVGKYYNEQRDITIYHHEL